ncbi:uncharacterized protein LOC113766078 [Coffea eugenioides]|uniref:uncharacterized protein LOC113766078 n=1 Tax=Coffea eugenioides TaxID=49369 RepID=UPI000F610AFE|nr:uncharacterized protein LOC113766078 [Coffea eugenioides]
MAWNEFQLAQGGEQNMTIWQWESRRRAGDGLHRKLAGSSSILMQLWTKSVEEALAIREAMVLAKRMGWRKVELESDCKLVVDKINAREEEVSIATIQLDIWRLMKDFDKCCCSYTRRSNNYVSHYLAKFAITLIDVAEWKLSFPAWLLELAQADLQEQLL